MKFLEKNWFKVGVLVVLASGVFAYWDNTKVIKSEESPLVRMEVKEEATTTPAVETIQKSAPVEKKVIKVDNSKTIISQLKSFDDYLEYDLIGADLDCMGFAVYNNAVVTGSMGTVGGADFKTAFPESKEFYKKKCEDSYMQVVMHAKILVAEPELQSLRTLLTSYTAEVKSFSQWALNDGYTAGTIDSSDAKMDNLRTLSREEVIRLKRTYKY